VSRLVTATTVLTCRGHSSDPATLSLATALEYSRTSRCNFLCGKSRVRESLRIQAPGLYRFVTNHRLTTPLHFDRLPRTKDKVGHSFLYTLAAHGCVLLAGRPSTQTTQSGPTAGRSPRAGKLETRSTKNALRRLHSAKLRRPANITII
jgi:hypothetical protein